MKCAISQSFAHTPSFSVQLKSVEEVIGRNGFGRFTSACSNGLAY